MPADFIGASYYQAMLNDSLDATNELLALLNTSCERLASVDWEPDVVQGAPGAVIVRVAESRRADEIVIGTRGRGRLRAALGSVAMEVLHRASCPVVVIPQRMFDANAVEPIEDADAALV